MANKSLTVHPDAEREYLTALEWYRERSLTAAVNFEEEVQRAISQVEQAPECWPSYFAVCRRFVLHQFPFSIVYRVYPSQVIVLAVAHGHRRPGYWKKRMEWKGPEPPTEQ